MGYRGRTICIFLGGLSNFLRHDIYDFSHQGVFGNSFCKIFSSQTNYLASVKHLLDFFSMASFPRFFLIQFLLCRNCFFFKLSLPYLISFINISIKTRFYNIMFIVKIISFPLREIRCIRECAIIIRRGEGGSKTRGHNVNSQCAFSSSNSNVGYLVILRRLQLRAVRRLLAMIQPYVEIPPRTVTKNLERFICSADPDSGLLF